LANDGAAMHRAIPYPALSVSGHVVDCETDGYALSAGGRAQDPPLPNASGVVTGDASHCGCPRVFPAAPCLRDI
jgi:hypothetical protein